MVSLIPLYCCTISNAKFIVSSLERGIVVLFRMALKIAFARRRSFHQLLQSVSFTFYIRFTSDAEYVLKEFLASLAILYNEICMDDEKACSRD